MDASPEKPITSHESVPARGAKLWLRCYPSYNPDLFLHRILENIRPTDHVLEIGTGFGQNKQNHVELRGRVARYAGIDPDASVLSNPYLHESRQAHADSLPFPDVSFDLVFPNYVAEHFESPLACHSEIARLLKSGGLLLVETPNRHYYVSLAAQFTPQWFHTWLVSRFATGRSSEEVLGATPNRQLQVKAP